MASKKSLRSVWENIFNECASVFVKPKPCRSNDTFYKTLRSLVDDGLEHSNQSSWNKNTILRADESRWLNLLLYSETYS